MKNRKEFKEQFTNEIQLPLSKTSEQYKKALDNIIFEQSLKETIAKLS
ncbi:MAG: hypothetical protein LBU27_04135 [Candidatus Peribacteria bacterium]|jgi:hypothetical protein|nr:hypothetical protein [Candidatus Peribacteria bacterium]